MKLDEKIKEYIDNNWLHLADIVQDIDIKFVDKINSNKEFSEDVDKERLMNIKSAIVDDVSKALGVDAESVYLVIEDL